MGETTFWGAHWCAILVPFGLLLCPGGSRSSNAFAADDSLTLDREHHDTVEDAVLRGRSLLYRESYYPASADSESAMDVSISPDVGADGIDIALPPVGGGVSGQVLGGETPLAGVVVEARRGSLIVAALTDLSGHFQIEGVPAGGVRVRFSTDHPLSAGETYESIYFGGVRSPSEATRVVTLDGQTTLLGPTILQLGATVAGRVRAESGEPVPDAEVTILAETESWSTRTDENGAYAQGGLPATAIRVQVHPPLPYLEEFYGGARELAEATQLLLDIGEQRTGVDVTLDRGAEIHGQIREEGTDEPRVDLEVELRLRGGPALRTTFTDGLGFYEYLGLPAGSYLVFVPRMNRYFPGVPTEAQARAIRVEEGEIRSQIDIEGPDVGGCAVPDAQQGGITGIVRADFSRIDYATLFAFSETDTLEQELTGEGEYYLGCMSEGAYRIALVPHGTLRTQYHPRVHDLGMAELVFVDGDTVRTIDFELEKTSWISGTIRDDDTGQPVPGVRVTARLDGRIQAESRSDELGRYRIDRRSDGSGLPSGTYRIRADSTLVPDPDVTPVLVPWMEVRSGGVMAEVHWELPTGFDWSYELSRSAVFDDDRFPRVVLLSGLAGTRETAGGRIFDRPTPGQYVYRLEAELAGESFEVVSDPVSVDGLAELFVGPNPWSGSGRLELIAPQRGGNGIALEVIDVTGRKIHRAEWPYDSDLTWDGRGANGEALSSGVYFVRQVDPLGRELARGELRIVR